MKLVTKVIAASLAATVLFTVSAYAREPEQISSTVTYVADDSYYVNIPASIPVGVDCSISAYDVNIAPGKTVKVRLGNLQYNEGIQLVSENDSSAVLCAKFYDKDAQPYTESNNVVASFNKLLGETQTATLRAEVDATADTVIAGNYSGTVYFDISCE